MAITTPKVGLNKAARDEKDWDLLLNQNFDILDELVGGISSVPSADQFTPQALVDPAIAPAASMASSGGTVAANNYKAKITFNGASGESAASPASVSVTTSGSTSKLYCQPLESPTGAVSYNVYWQTGGSGSYFRGHTNVPLTAADVQTTTPATSGPTPLSTSTANSVVAAALLDISGNPGRFQIPSTLLSTSGFGGNLSANQSFQDNRFGHFSTVTTKVSPNKSAVGALGSAWFLDLQVPSQLSEKQQWQGLEIIAHAQDTPSYWGGISDADNVVALAASTIRDGTRTEGIWGANFVVDSSNNLGVCFGTEIDVNYFATPVQNENGGIGVIIRAGGNQQAWEAIHINAGGGGAQWFNAIDIRPNTYGQSGLVIGPSSGSSFGIDCNHVIRAHGASGSDLFVRDSDSSGAALYDRWKDNGAAKWTLAKTTSNDLQLFDEANSGFTRLAFNAGTNGNTLINAPGTGAVVVPNSDIQLTLGKLDTKSGGSTSISTGAGSVKMSTANNANNAAWIPMKYNGTTYFVPAWTTNAP